MSEPIWTTDATLAEELAAIGARLESLATGGDDKDGIGQELGAIRAHLRQIARGNAEVGARLAVSLGLETPS